MWIQYVTFVSEGSYKCSRSRHVTRQREKMNHERWERVKRERVSFREGVELRSSMAVRSELRRKQRSRGSPTHSWKPKCDSAGRYGLFYDIKSRRGGFLFPLYHPVSLFRRRRGTSQNALRIQWAAIREHRGEREREIESERKSEEEMMRGIVPHKREVPLGLANWFHL